MHEESSDLIDDLTNAEILQLCGLSPVEGKILDIIKREEEKGSLEILRDEAYAKYWQRRLETVTALDEEAVLILLGLPEFASARSVLGDAVILNKLSPKHVDTVIANTSPHEWTHRQVLARRMLDRFSNRDFDAGNAKEDFRKTISDLIGLKTTWAILDILPSLTCRELTDVLARMQDPKILNKHNRHLVREAIQRQLKKN